LVLVGRAATAALVVLGLLWIPFMKYISSQLYIYLQSVQAYIAPPIAACFLFGVFLPALNGVGAIASLVTGFVLGAGRLVLELANGSAKTGLPDGTVWAWIAEVNFLHYAVLLFVVCSAVLFGVSRISGPPAEERVGELVYRPGTAVVSGQGRLAAASATIAAILGVLWVVFA
jgi:SSS family solute:Na+ symporter